jgi:di/tricarboxylate transporter
VFAGATDSVADLQKIRGLAPATNQLFKLDTPRADRRLIEVVIALNSSLAGQTVRDSRFRSRFNAVVIAVGRDGARVRGKVGDIVLKGGDMLLVESEPRLRPGARALARLPARPPAGGRAGAPLRARGGRVGGGGRDGVAAAFGWLSMLNAAMLPRAR